MTIAADFMPPPLEFAFDGGRGEPQRNLKTSFTAIAGMEPQIRKDIAGSSLSMFATLSRRNGARRGRWNQSKAEVFRMLCRGKRITPAANSNEFACLCGTTHVLQLNTPSCRVPRLKDGLFD